MWIGGIVCPFGVEAAAKEAMVQAPDNTDMPHWLSCSDVALAASSESGLDTGAGKATSCGGANLLDLGRKTVPVFAHLSPFSNTKKLCILLKGRSTAPFLCFCRTLRN
eukprot:CAMPEP_0184288564 /NCGR_PEP_ID=MMETSP1049-20130417/1084_1 /TAXON_ID=77928 /ORGANISM="Proteomonas sulcata, Strain CCMP704" /LENGTH=107 /DNA_ID=CAMNT_0026595033 /DNA_START=301 /DNA_END=624 /DNA_ORIENTATION=+